MATKYWDDDAADGDLNTASNWDSDTKFGASDDVYFDQGDNDILLNLDQSGTAINSLRISQAFEVAMGAATTYAQWDVGTGVAEIGYYDGVGTPPAGSGRLMLDFGNNASEIIVHNTGGVGTETGQMPCRIIAANASSTVEILGDSMVGLATAIPTDTATIGTVTQLGASSQLVIGRGCTLTTFNQDGGSSLVLKTPTTVNVDGGQCEVRATSGTITTIRIGGGGVLDLTGAQITVTNAIEMHAGSTLRMHSTDLTLTGGIQLERCGFQDVTITDTAAGVTWS